MIWPTVRGQLISDERVPEDPRVFYAIALLGGLRTGEVSALHFRAYDAAREPLGSLLVAALFNTRTRVEKSVKTGKPREVPIHPTLAKVLAAWKLSGWRRMMGRAPGADGVLVPKQDGRNRDAHLVLYWFRRDCEALGLRKRRQYDSRRTFVSLAQADGARKDILRWISHGPEGDIVSLYTTLPWPALCAEVAKLRVELREGRLLEFRQVASGACDSPCYTEQGEAKKPRSLADFERTTERPRRDSNPAAPVDPRRPSPANGADSEQSDVASPGPDGSSAESTVTLSHEAVSQALEDAGKVWARSGDPEALRKALLEVLRRLDGER